MAELNVGTLQAADACFCWRVATTCRAWGSRSRETFRALLGLESVDGFNADLLRDEPTDKVKRLIAEARSLHSL